MANDNAKHKARDILARLEKLESSQHHLMDRLKDEHQNQMAALRAKLELANQRRTDLQVTAEQNGPEPLLMSVNMTEVEQAVQAASNAERESALARDEARKVAEDARLAAGGIPQSMREAARDGEVGFGPDSEYIVKKVSVNLDEVERAINTSAYVSVCRAFGRPDAKYGNEVYCAVVPKKNVRVSEPMLQIHAQKYLPTPMVPRRFFFLEDLPSGITRKALADTHIARECSPKSLTTSESSQLPALEN